MQLYAIMRRSVCPPEEIEAADERSNQQADARAGRMRKIRSYLFEEEDGRVGTVCLYEATGPEALREHAAAADIPADEIVPVTATDVARPDPEPATT